MSLKKCGGGNFLKLLQKEEVPRKGGGRFPQKRGGSNPGGNYTFQETVLKRISLKNQAPLRFSSLSKTQLHVAVH